jgi:large subunit ribosomal protein L15
MSGELSRLEAPPGANREGKRKGKGIGSGLGKTSGRGAKGQKARKSGHVRPGFEGGQMSIFRRLPKRGFWNPFENHWAEVRLGDLNGFKKGELVDEAALRAQRIVKGRWDGVKILNTGELKVAVSVKVNRITKSAKEKIEALGGKVELIADRVAWERSDTRTKRRASKQKKA